MTNKTLSLFSLGILALLVLTSFASAFTLNLGAFDGDSAVLTITTEIGESGTITLSSVGDLDVSFNSTAVSEDTNNYIQVDASELKYGEYDVTINATLGTKSNSSNTVTYTKGFYDGDTDSYLSIDDIELDIVDGFGDDETFYPFDEMEIIVEIGTGDYDIEDIEIKACIWDVDKEKCIYDEDDMDIDLDGFDLEDDDTETVTMTLVLDADELTSGNTEYEVYVSAVGNVDDDDADADGNIEDGDEVGDWESKKFEIVTDDDFVIINNIQFNTESASCGDTIELTADVWNIGDDLDDDEIYVRVYNKDLGIDELLEFSSGIDALESETITLTFEVPEDAEETSYKLQLTAYNKENFADKYIFENEEDDTAVFNAYLTIAKDSCSSTSSTPTATVSVSDSEVKAGQQLIVKATIVNTGSTAKTFTLSASSYADWASSATLDKNSITLNAGASQEVSITLEVLEDVSGENGFDIEVVEGNKFLSQPVTVTIEKASSFDITGLVSGFGDNAYLYGIGALNLILVAGIIFVAVKIARKKKQE